MAKERDFTFLNCLCYLYNAFAVYTDGDLDEAEKNEIRNIVGEWCPDQSRNDVSSSLDKTLGWFSEDLKADLEEEDSQKVPSMCVGIARSLKENMTPENCKAVHNDLVRIGNADGHYDETEQKWATALGKEMGVL